SPPIEEITAALTACGPCALRDFLNHVDDDRTIDQRFGPQDTSLARAHVVPGAACDIERGRNRADSVGRAGMADEPTGAQWSSRLCDFIPGLLIRRNQSRSSQSQRDKVTRIATMHVKRRHPNRFLITQNILEKIFFKRCR